MDFDKRGEVGTEGRSPGRITNMENIYETCVEHVCFLRFLDHTRRFYLYFILFFEVQRRRSLMPNSYIVRPYGTWDGGDR